MQSGTIHKKGGENIKGYVTSEGYMGWVEEYGRYILFATEAEYYDYLER